MAKKKSERIDGLGPDDLKKIHSAVRRVWAWSYARRLAIKRSIGEDGFYRCESCLTVSPKVHVDHIEAVGEVGGANYIQRMFCSSQGLQILCASCHRKKTNLERKACKYQSNK